MENAAVFVNAFPRHTRTSTHCVTPGKFSFTQLSPICFFHKMGVPISELGASLGGSVVKNLPAKQETPVQSLGQEDPLEKEMPTHSSVRIPWTEETGGLQGSQESQT